MDDARSRATALPELHLPGVDLGKVIRSALRFKIGLVGGVLMFVLFFFAAFGGILAPHDPTEPFLEHRLAGPSSEHWFGNDELGRDVLSRLLVGTQVTVKVGLLATGLSALIGIPMGLLGGFWGRAFDYGVVYVVNILLAFPGILLAMTLVGVLGPGTTNISIALAIAGIPGFARLARASALSLREVSYVEAARTVGASDFRIILKHIWPNSTAPLIVSASLSFGFAAFGEAALSFLGIGVQPPAPTWGGMIRDGLNFLRSDPHMVLFPSIAIFVTILAANLLGDGLRDALDPRLRGRA
jgi:peptide/nickel transport system permease protein